jgi:chromate reductase
MRSGGAGLGTPAGLAHCLCMSKIAIIVGSLRRESYNRQLAEALIRLPQAKDHTFEFLEIGDLPLYDQDTDDNQPAPAKRLKQQIRAADGVMFVTPEYNRSVPGVLKNAIDHASRPFGDSAWKKKPAGIIGVSPGAMGTGMAQQHLRNILAGLDMPTLGLPEAYLVWKEGLLTPDGEVGIDSREFLGSWLGAFLKLVERYAVAPEPVPA